MVGRDASRKCACDAFDGCAPVKMCLVDFRLDRIEKTEGDIPMRYATKTEQRYILKVIRDKRKSKSGLDGDQAWGFVSVGVRGSGTCGRAPSSAYGNIFHVHHRCRPP